MDKDAKIKIIYVLIARFTRILIMLYKQQQHTTTTNRSPD